MKLSAPVRRGILAASGLVVLLAAWEGAVAVGLVSSQLIPRPSHLPITLVHEISSGIWAKMVLHSLTHYALGLGIGSVLGIVAGGAAALFPRFEALQAYVVRLLRPIPPLAWIPFAIIWFGITETAAAFIIAIGIFWINYFATSGAIAAVDPDLVEVARSLGHTSFPARVMKVILSAASGGIMTGVRTGIGQGWMTVIASELFGITGIGQRMMEASGLLAIDVVAVYMFTIAGLYALTDGIFVLISKGVLSWQRA